LNKIQELKKLDARVLNTTTDDTQNIFTLSKALTEGLTTDLEKTYVIYKWVTNNIEYDTVAFTTGNFRGIGNANTVIQRRKAICDGYSELIMRLGIQAGLNVKKIGGYAKGYGYQVGVPLTTPNHAWNTVQIDGKWYLLDATWDAGGVSNDGKQYFKNKNDYVFFLTNPQIFRYSHLPEHDEWQLTNTTWDKKDFFSKVNITETAFKLGLNIEKQNNAVINVDSLPYALDFDSGVMLIGGLVANNTNLSGQWVFEKYDTKGNAKLLVSAPSNGSYILQLYASTQKNVNYFSGFMQYKFNVNNSLNNFSNFPQTFPIYHNSKVILEAPLSGVLSSNQNTRFKLRVNGAKKIVISQNQKNTDMEVDSEGYFNADIKLEKGDLMLFGDFGVPNQLDGILKYRVN
jgi:transglutaminase/protease-like cytokinesis protein 3